MKANTEKLNMGKRFIPRSALNRLGAIFLEGIPKYGKNNWKQGVFDDAYQEERLEHAIDHLYRWIEGDRSEDHLAKVMWFCSTQIELERLEEESVNQSLPDPYLNNPYNTISDPFSTTNSFGGPQAHAPLRAKNEAEIETEESELYKQEIQEDPIEKLLKNIKKTFMGNAGD